MNSRKLMISLEAYVDFVYSHKQRTPTKNVFNQIISIHGFRRLQASKTVMCDALKTLDVMDPSRSTLKSNISANARLTEEEIIGELKRLEWLECCVTSIQTLNSSPEQQSILKAQAKDKVKAKRKRSASVAVAEGADSISSVLVPLRSSGDLNWRENV